VGILKQFNGFSHFGEMSDLIAKLENNLYRQEKDGQTAIHFESNALLKGIGLLTPAYQAVLHKTPLLITYQSFNARTPSQAVYYPYLLKEFRNRWFLIVKHKFKNGLLNLALDRIQEMTEVPGEEWQPYGGVNFERYYEDVIGVTKSERDRPSNIRLKFTRASAPYVITKPLHASQTIEKQDESGMIIKIKVVINFELEKEILSFGEQVTVLAPRNLVGRIQRRLKEAVSSYER
jgi:predicted DNA-binding transcriptional regulator YafY